ncbi:MGMT family protein [Dielma fastidiosa]|uniref:Methylated-DNA-protein-cysteine methyltransferase-like protein n=1 Tax=Dielma fastidiosa TaxID=1034346 RepID=A0A318KLC5_9FIRM|nr:methylated-DNA--[protein]-cysteine S-methyltransferase [Dielma fastidiosa]PXX78270.1 methylated-DNA-protein-cysteine methyltransferase-like protein [Dielma fastidiosa]
MNEDFAYMVLEIVREIPKGKVASYSQIAALSGYPKRARMVGKILSQAEYFGRYPCHRVLHSDGRLVTGWEEQRELLASEGVFCTASGKIDMASYQWEN